MKNEVSIPLIRSVYSLCKKIVQENFSEELGFFDAIWKIMQDYLTKWKDVSPEKWLIKESREKVISGLGFTDVSQALDLVTPAIITTLSATMIAIRDLGYIPRDEEVHKIIDKYAPAFGARGILVNLMKRYFKDLCETLPEILKEKEEKKEFVEIKGEEEIVKEKAFARVWTLKTKDPENGEIISKKRYEEIIEDEEIPLLITKSNGIRSIFMNGDAKNLSPLKFDLLEYFLKNRGHGGDIINLLEKVWKDKERAKKLRKEDDKDSIRDETSHLRGEITSLNKFLLKNLRVEIKSHRSGQYKFTRSLKYYLIEIF